MVSLGSIFIKFFKISSTTFGGGMTMFPILQKEIVQGENWATDEEIVDIYALSQGLPGIIAINIAAFIGYRKRGFLGALVGGLGIVSPCILVILLVSIFLQNFQDSALVNNAFAGISVGVTALLFNSVLSLWKKSIVDKLNLIIYISTVLTMVFLNISPAIIILISGIMGIIYKNQS